MDLQGLGASLNISEVFYFDQGLSSISTSS